MPRGRNTAGRGLALALLLTAPLAALTASCPAPLASEWRCVQLQSSATLAWAVAGTEITFNLTLDGSECAPVRGA
jgi:hypothetical protein